MTGRVAAKVFVAVVLLTAFASDAQAQNRYPWYGSYYYNYNCWQSGTPPTSTMNQQCRYVATAGYLPNNTVQGGGIAAMVYPNGDYCNHYTDFGAFNVAPTGNGAPYTGLTTPTPYSSYQWGDYAGNMCQARDSGGHTFYGQHTASSGTQYNSGTLNRCWSACGVNRTVSFRDSDYRPWSSAFANPSLEVFFSFRPEFYYRNTSAGGGWGYYCAILQDMASGAGNPYIEYCIELWQPHTKAESLNIWPPQNNEINSTDKDFSDGIHCQTAQDGRAMPLSIAALGVGSNRVTQYDGANTQVATGRGLWHNFHFTISRTNLQNTIAKVNQECWVDKGQPGVFSSNPANYRMVSIEAGSELWRTSTSIGTSGGYMALYTIY